MQHTFMSNQQLSYLSQRERVQQRSAVSRWSSSITCSECEVVCVKTLNIEVTRQLPCSQHAVQELLVFNTDHHILAARRRSCKFGPLRKLNVDAEPETVDDWEYSVASVQVRSVPQSFFLHKKRDSSGLSCSTVVLSNENSCSLWRMRSLQRVHADSSDMLWFKHLFMSLISWRMKCPVTTRLVSAFVTVRDVYHDATQVRSFSDFASFAASWPRPHSWQMWLGKTELKVFKVLTLLKLRKLIKLKVAICISYKSQLVG